MTIDSKPGPTGASGAGDQLAGVDIDTAAIAGLTDGDIIAFRYDSGTSKMVPFRFATHASHKLTLTSNGDYIDLDLAP